MKPKPQKSRTPRQSLHRIKPEKLAKTLLAPLPKMTLPKWPESISKTLGVC